MKKYRVTIHEEIISGHYFKSIEVEAKDEEEAKKIASEHYTPDWKEEYDVEFGDHSDCEVEEC